MNNNYKYLIRLSGWLFTHCLARFFSLMGAASAHVLRGYTHRDVRTFFCSLGGKLKVFAHTTHKQ